MPATDARRENSASFSTDTAVTVKEKRPFLNKGDGCSCVWNAGIDCAQQSIKGNDVGHPIPGSQQACWRKRRVRPGLLLPDGCRQNIRRRRSDLCDHHWQTSDVHKHQKRDGTQGPVSLQMNSTTEILSVEGRFLRPPFSLAVNRADSRQIYRPRDRYPCGRKHSDNPPIEALDLLQPIQSQHQNYLAHTIPSAETAGSLQTDFF